MMIDLHSHILHGFDDGAVQLSDSLAMAMMAADDGIRVLAATPHGPGSFASQTYSPDLVRARVAELNAILQGDGVPLEIIAGTELAYADTNETLLKRGAVLPYAETHTILFEPPYGALGPGFDTAIFRLQAQGYRVLLAHPERIPDVQDKPNRLIPLIERGVLMQLTAETIIGGQGERMQQLAETLLTHGMIHVLASDGHGAPPRRAPLLSAARERAAALIGAAAATAMVETTPHAILHDLPITPATPRPAERHFLRRRA